MTRYNQLRQKWPHFAAEAIDDLGLTDADLAGMSPREIIDAVLSWQGIIGFTDSILEFVRITIGEKE